MLNKVLHVYNIVIFMSGSVRHKADRRHKSLLACPQEPLHLVRGKLWLKSNHSELVFLTIQVCFHSNKGEHLNMRNARKNRKKPSSHFCLEFFNSSGAELSTKKSQMEFKYNAQACSIYCSSVSITKARSIDTIHNFTQRISRTHNYNNT